jgi:outer membrane lipoprotein-sorting protein
MSGRHLLAAALLLLLTAHASAASGTASSDLFAQPANANDLLQALGPLTAELKAAQTLRGRYVQTKHLRELPRPLLSEGSFLFVRDHGVVWRTEKPFASELVITGDALIQQQNGQRQRLSAEQQPAVRQIGQIFFAVFSLDLPQLERLFSLHGGAQGAQANGWVLGLKPLQNAGNLREIEVQGARQVQRVWLREDGGDLTGIELQQVQVSAQPPTADDLQAFQP